MKVSIIIPYYNKRTILFNTLKSIEHFNNGYDIEVVVVDDGSNKENSIEDYPGLFPSLNINLLILNKPKTRWRSPAISYNTGFLHAKGDVFMLNGADCMHLGDILKYTFNNFTDNTYLSFSSYRGTDNINESLKRLNWDKLEEFVDTLPKSSIDNWHVHTKFFIKLYPFVACLSRADVERLSGYDERYSNGVAFDDDDIVQRIENLKLKIKTIDNPFCMHQKHPYTQYYSQANRHLFNHLQKTEPHRIKAQHNNIYVK